jgi:DnaJ-domain-containing protein 1
MRLDHDSGAMSGRVLEGQFQGRALDSMNLDELLALHAECRIDEQSVAVLEAYLDREQPDEWRERYRASGGRPGEDGAARPDSRMSREEAYQVLGLDPGATDEEIVAAHRRLMQKLHPDRGGSTFLAAKINQAKELLMGR